MYTVTKTLEISASHRLSLPYESKCKNLHGHNWIIKVTCQSRTLDENGLVTDFAEIKKMVTGALDHSNLNDLFDQPTAENIAQWIQFKVPNCVKVSVQESSGNVAVYERDDL